MKENTAQVPGFVRAWRTWKIVWAVLRNLIVLFTAMAAYSRASSNFESITLSVLILILQGVEFGFTQRSRAFFEEGLVIRRLALGLYEKTGEDISDTLEVSANVEKITRERTRFIGSTW